MFATWKRLLAFPLSTEQRAVQSALSHHRDLMRVLAALLLASSVACTHSDAARSDSSAHLPARPGVNGVSAQSALPPVGVETTGAETASHGPLPPRAAADSVLTRYLDLVAERDGFTPAQFAGIYSDAMPCAEEEFGDVIHSYWLARGRILGYEAAADTLRAQLELLTVAAQEPSTTSAYGSIVTARLQTDTLWLKLVPDSTRHGWLTCGLLSDGHRLGGYGRPDNVQYSPPSVTRAKLLAQVDSIRQAANTR